jgi:hypothetical protein
MEVAQWWIIGIALPAVLIIALIWLVMKRSSNRTTDRTEASTRDLYREEEERRREGTDQAEK